MHRAPVSVRQSRIAKKWIRLEEYRNERFVHLVHLVVGGIVVVLALTTGPEMTRLGMLSMLGSGAIITIYGIVAIFLFRGRRRSRAVKYISTTLDLLLVTAAAIAIGGHGAFKGAIPLVYYIIIGAAAFRFSPRLTLIAGAGSVVSHAGVFIWCVVSGTCSTATLSISLSSSAVSPAMLVVHMVFLLIFTGLMAALAHRFRVVVARSISNELRVAHEREITSKTRAALQRFVTDKVADKILTDDLTLSGERKTVTILFSDIREFTRMSEGMKPEEIVELLNEYFEAMIDVVFEFGGTLDKFIGDGLMAVFGAPLGTDHDEEMAIRAALKMREVLIQINIRRQDGGKKLIRIGTGIHTGIAVAGYVGSLRRMEYTVIGSSVNLASRIEEATKQTRCDILLSEETYRRVQNLVDATEKREVRAKGFRKKVKVFRLNGLKLPTQAGGQSLPVEN